MLQLSKRLDVIRPSLTLALNARVKERIENGVDVINLTLGEPDFSTPLWIQDAVTQALKEGMTRYTPTQGVLPLRKAIQKKFQKDYGLDYSVNMITIGAGTKQLIFNAMLATLNPGDEVIIPVPYWVSYPDIVQLCQGVPVFATCHAQNNFKLDVDELRYRITSRTKWLILNSPNNPSGSVYTKQELFDLAQVLVKYPHVHILCDDIYELLVFDDLPFHSLVKLEPRLHFRSLICNGVSKSYAMTGFRLGYAAGPEPIIQAMNLLQSQSTSNVCSLSQAAAIAALNGPQDFIKEWRLIYDERRHYLHQTINSIDGLEAFMPQGAFYLYVNCEKVLQKKAPNGAWITSDEELCAYFLETANVAVVGGAAFGLSPYFRLSYATPLETLKSGCMRIAHAISQLS